MHYDPGVRPLLSSPAPLGVLVANTGTPDAPTPQAVRRYLAQFLSDPRIIEFPRWLWLPVLHGIILNTRPRRSARLYQRIWTEKGSPLLENTTRIAQALQTELAARLEHPVLVEAGMCYGNPGIPAALRRLAQAGVEQIVVLPLFPQYSATTTAAIFDKVFTELRTWRHQPGLRMLREYHTHPAYITALAGHLRQRWQTQGQPERLLFSFHGIPERYAAQGDPYPEQCRQSAQLLAAALDLAPERWAWSFQSRFGPQRWLQPYTDKTLQAWGGENLPSLEVVCPGFAADCLETLDEVAHEGRKVYEEAGGRGFAYVPALNDSPEHIRVLADLIV